MRSSRILGVFFICSMVVLLRQPASSQDQGVFSEKLLENFVFRSLGPYRCGSWVTDYAVPDSPSKAHLYTFYVATRNGGVWKTTNNGTTFEPVFDDQPWLSIGALAVAPSNGDIVWVGTGESYCTRSSNRGDGVYKSTDGGKTWSNMGLRDSQHIARIIIHPGDPETVYVAAMGHLFTANAERGVFKTVDGGKSWKKVLFINDKVGAIDLAINKQNPDVLYAAAYDKVRLPWHYEASGPESAIYKTTDGGTTWSRLTGGLPSGKIGRIGLDVYQKNPETVYAFVENANKRPPSKEEAARDEKRGLRPQERTIGGEVFRTDDGGKTWIKMNTGEEELGTKAPYSFNQIRVDQNNDKHIFVTGVSLANSIDGGKTWYDADWPMTRLFLKAFGDVRTLWIDPQNSDRMLFGSDGGVYVTYDGGKTSDHLWNIPLGEFYAIGVDMEDPYNIYGGLQDHDSWKGPSNGWSGEVSLCDWVTIGGGDGMFNVVDPADSRWVYNCREFGGFRRVDQKLGTTTDIAPRRGKSMEPLRYNWTPPIHLSPHNGAVVYVGAQVLLRSLDRGDRWEEISPDLTTIDPAKLHGEGYITYCTITTISESPLKPGTIWVGTDDGKVQVTKNGGTSWQDVTQAVSLAGGPVDFWVSRVFASSHDPGTAYVCKTGYRYDDARPFIFKTKDYGETWAPLMNNLPERCVNVIFEDRKNADLLFAGTDGGVYVSMDGGKKWVSFKNNMPWVKVTDLLVHPRENDLVVATFGRGLFVTDITPLQQINATVLAADVFLFEVKPAVQRMTPVWGNYQLMGDRTLATPNEPQAVSIYYYLKDNLGEKEKAKITVANPWGEVLAEIEGKGEAGINTVLWEMRPKPVKEPDEQYDSDGRALIDPGEYVVTLEAGGRKLTSKALIKKRTGWSFGPFPVLIK